MTPMQKKKKKKETPKHLVCPRGFDAGLVIFVGLDEGGIRHVAMWIKPRVSSDFNTVVAEQEHGSWNIRPSFGLAHIDVEELLMHVEILAVESVVFQEPTESHSHLRIAAVVWRGSFPAPADNAALFLGSHRSFATTQGNKLHIEGQQRKLFTFWSREYSKFWREVVCCRSTVPRFVTTGFALSHARHLRSRYSWKCCHPPS